MRRTRPRLPRPRAEWELEAETLWERNKAIRKRFLSQELTAQELQRLPPELRGELSPQAFQSVPSQLRLPVEVRGLAPLKGLRAETLFQYLLRLSVVFPEDKRFTDFLSALFEHEIIVPNPEKSVVIRGKRVVKTTHRFSRKQRLEYNEHSQSKLLAELRARKEVRSELRASKEIAAEWGLPNNSLDAAAKGLRDKLLALRKRP
jgi:hypothetical protein